MAARVPATFAREYLEAATILEEASQPSDLVEAASFWETTGSWRLYAGQIELDQYQAWKVVVSKKGLRDGQPCQPCPPTIS